MSQEFTTYRSVFDKKEYIKQGYIITYDNLDSVDDLPELSTLERQDIYHARTGDLSSDYIVPVDTDGSGSFDAWYSLVDGEEIIAIPQSAITRNSDHIWPFAEGSGDALEDTEGDKDGNRNSPDWVVDDGGVQDAYLNFGSDDIVDQIGRVFDGDASSGFTVTAWVRGGSNEGYIWTQDAADRLLTWINDSGELDFDSGGGRPTTTNYPDNDWFLMTAVGSDSDGEARLYVDDNLESTDSGGPASDADNPFYIGNRDGTDRPLGGDIDFVTVALDFEAELSDVQDHYNATKDRYE